MSTITEISAYMERAGQARADADAATLDNVRDRCLRAEAAWLEMASRARRTQTMRKETEELKAGRPPYVRTRSPAPPTHE